MPGILPMKMIRVGMSTQSRIAQACDRCRSKKIRCDGVRPCCTQCANVGFECKTSDKLSRRAFPRGYTESLEDRVRALETEVRELKTLLDEKDEKIDMLSRIHNFSPISRKISLSPSTSTAAKPEDELPHEEMILIELPAAVQPTSSSNGTPTTAALIEAFEEKIHGADRPCPAMIPSSLLNPHHLAGKLPTAGSASYSTATPPRLLSDQYINIFFQEWQPLLPILHRPTFLRIYEQYLLDPDLQPSQKSKGAIAQLFLIFEIAAHSSSSKTRPVTTAYESQWRRALSTTSSIPNVATLQNHILAQLCYLLKADYPHLLRHRAYAVSMVHQLGLHQGHKCHSLPAFEAETRKKVFWCQYVLDKFVSAATGTPQLLRDDDISADYPADIDDENINAQGISPALPGELTKISSALALFRVSRILAKSLESLYPSKSSYQLSVTKLHSLSDELDQWQEELPDHLRLRFRNDKPATNVISCRSPLLSLAYFYIRGLIHRPLLCHGSGSAASAAMIVLAAAAKHKLQILDLLDERSMNYTFPLNKQDILIGAGFSILWQSIALSQDSKLIKDNQRSMTLLLSKLSKECQPAASEFQKIAKSVMPGPETLHPSARTDDDTLAARASSAMPAPTIGKARSTCKQLQAMASRLSSFNGKAKHEDGLRRASMSQPNVYTSSSPNARAGSTTSLSSTQSAPILPVQPVDCSRTKSNCQDPSAINLDYFPLIDDTTRTSSSSSSSTMLPPLKINKSRNSHAEWDVRRNRIGKESPEAMLNADSPTPRNRPASLCGAPTDWPSDLWEITAFDFGPKENVAQSLLSFSEESLTSGEEQLFSAAGSYNGSNSTHDMSEYSTSNAAASKFNETFQGMMMPSATDDEFDFDEIEA